MYFMLGLTPWQWGLSIIFLVSLFVQLYFYLHYYLQPTYRINDEKKQRIHYLSELPPVSVVIYANNDSEQLRNNLEYFLTQDYPEFEIIVVNDGSSDESEDVLSEFEAKFSNLYHTFVAEGARNLSRRKLSLTLGIKAARYDIVLLSDANCRPGSNRWIYSFARNFTEKTDLVIGCTILEKHKGLFERLTSFDVLLHNLRFIGYALSNKPYMGEGTNLAYRKSLFFAHKGFAKFMQLHTGDDDLFVNQVANRRNTKIELSADSRMTAIYESNIEGWLYQKRNRAFTSSFYKTGAKMSYAFDSFTRFLYYGCGIAVIILSWPILWLCITIMSFMLIRFVLTGLFWRRTGKIFNTRRFFFLVPFLELIDPLINIYFKLESYIDRKQNYTWRFQ